MYLDLEDYRPDTPRVPQAISLREGVLASLLAHALFVIAYLLAPQATFREAVALPSAQQERDPIQFVHMVPSIERQATPRVEREHSDLDRRSSSPDRAPNASNSAPFSVGDTREKVVGAPTEKPVGPENGTSQPTPPAASAMMDLAAKAAPASPTTPSQAAGGGLANSLKNLSRYLQDQNFDNQQGGLTDRMPDIQFDSKGVEFGPWLRRFVQQVKRNWNVPTSMFQSGRVVIQFYVLRNGTITELKVVSPSQFPAYTNAAYNALKNSNPVLPLPTEYPDDRAFFTVTFHYDVRVPDTPSAALAIPGLN